MNSLGFDVTTRRMLGMHDIMGRAWARVHVQNMGHLHAHDCHQDVAEHSTTSCHRISHRK